MALVCKYSSSLWVYIAPFKVFVLTGTSYNGSSDLQLERMNVYFNEVCSLIPLQHDRI